MKRITFGFMTFLVVIVVVEIVMSLAGFGYEYFQQIHHPNEQTNNDTITILCVGESTTAWGLSESYPAQFQQRLTNLFGPGKYKVINAGVAATDTSQILKSMPMLLETHKPKIVISMMGVNDFWKIEPPGIWNNLHIYKLYKLVVHNVKILINSSVSRSSITEKKLAYHTPPHAFKNMNLFNSAVAELEAGRSNEARIRFYNFAKENSSAGAYSEVGEYYYVKFGVFHRESQKIARGFFKKALALDPNDKVALKYLGCGYYNTADDKNKAFPYLKKAYDLGSRDSAVLASLADLYKDQGKITEAESILKSGLEYGDNLFLWTRLIDLQIQKKEYEMAIQNLTIANNEHPGNGALRNLKNRLNVIQDLPNEEIYTVYNFLDFPSTQSNYKELARLLELRGIRHVVMNYPMRSNDQLKMILGNFRGILFVDLKEDFEKTVSTQGYEALFIDNFGGDFGHFTKKGSAIIVDKLIQDLESHKILR